MRGEFSASDLARGVRAFQDSYDSWEEYGVSDEDAAEGLLSALVELGFVSSVSAGKVVELMRRFERRRTARTKREFAAREAVRHARMTAEEIAREKSLRGMMNQSSMHMRDVLLASVLDTKFRSDLSL